VPATPEPSEPGGDALGGAAPAPLTVAASLVAVEALLLVLQGVAELAALSPQRLAMGVTTALFFLAYGAGLGACAWGLHRLRSVARAPIVVAQLLQVMVAWSFWGGSTTWLAVALAVVALVVLAGILHPASLAALDPEDRAA
jgi:hypothetical protein